MRLLAAALLFSALPSWAIVTAETEAAARKLGAVSVGEVEFDSGQTGLTTENKSGLSDLKQEALQAGDIKEVRVIAWADKEYPPEQQKKYTSADIKLADERARSIEKYLKNDLKLSGIVTYNMAKRPNVLQEMLKTPSAAIKDTLEKSGAAPHTEKDTGLFAEKSKSSTALIFVFKQSMTDNKLFH